MNDFKLNTDLELEIANGDFMIGDSTSEHQELLIHSSKGDWKENPTVGVGAAMFLKDDDTLGLPGEIKKEFERDGMTVNSIGITAEKIQVDAHY